MRNNKRAVWKLTGKTISFFRLLHMHGGIGQSLAIRKRAIARLTYSLGTSTSNMLTYLSPF